jgi:hypothetical protein
MAEPRRVQLTTVTPLEPSQKPKKVTKPSVRFNLVLTETTDKICPEFSFTELLKNALVSREKHFILCLFKMSKFYFGQNTNN